MRASQVITEIERLSPDDYEGGAANLYYLNMPKKTYKLPGPSGLIYGVTGDRGWKSILIIDPQGTVTPQRPNYYNYRAPAPAPVKKEVGPQIVGSLSISRESKFFLPNSYHVGTITVDENYRGIGIAKALYGIALTSLKLNLVAGDSQTPGGRRNWASLSKIPGCEVVGVLKLGSYHLAEPRGRGNTTDQYEHEVGAMVDRLMTIGCDYQGKFGGYDYFIFPIKLSKNELKTAIKGKVNLYHNNADDPGGYWETSLLARWLG